MASLAAQAFHGGRRFGFVAPGRTVEAGLGPGQLERILGALARIDFTLDSAPPIPPVSPLQCVLVSNRPGTGHGFGDLYSSVEGFQP